MSKGAGEALAEALAAALNGIGLAGVHEEGPVQASFPYAAVDCGLESDWGHKTGEGRELRVILTLRDRAERPVRLRRLAAAAEAAALALPRAVGGWDLVGFVPLRSRLQREPGGRWAAAIELRARMLKEV